MIAANPELQEREALKGLALTASMTEALERRDTPALTACLAAQLGALALKIAYERWSHTLSDSDFGELARRTLREIADDQREALRPMASETLLGLCKRRPITRRAHPNTPPPLRGFATQ